MPLKHDQFASQYSSGPLNTMASLVYMEMTRLGCKKFVRPMPVDDFLSDFIPEATQKRPVDV